MSADSLRMPPQSVEAEQHVLGALMIRPEALHKLVDWLAPEDFYRRDHQLIYRAICNLTERKIPADALTVGEWFESQGLGAQVPGGYLIDLASNTHSAANVVAYAEIVTDKAKLRKLVEVGTGIVNDGFQPEGRDTAQLVASAQQAITQLAGNPRIGGVKTMRDIGARWYDELLRRYENRGALIGLPTPWAEFNRRTSGLQPGNLVVLAARPSMGKSAWAVNVSTANAIRGKRVLFFNLEMTDVSIYNRAIASLENVPLAWLRSPDDEGDHFAQVTAAVSQLKGASLLIDDTPGLRIEQIIARARREHMRAPLDMLIVDHLHLIPLPGKTRETVEIGAITAALKSLAKELAIPVVLLAQLNRSVESRPNKRPVMSDLRESGNIEQDADLIVFLYRDDYYAARDERPSEHPGAVEMIIAKQREGEAGKVWARDALAFGRIDDHDGPPPQAEPRTESPKGRRWAGFAHERRAQ
jgi:replicative DNA helicase